MEMKWSPGVAQKEATRALRKLATLQTKRRQLRRKLRDTEANIRAQKKEARAILQAALADTEQLPAKWAKWAGGAKR